MTAIVVPLKKFRPTFKNTILVGRSDSNDVCIPHQSVSKLHARLWLRDEEVVIADAGSTHGTVVDGQRVDGERTLRSGCVIEFGDCCFRFLDTDSLVDALSRLSTRGEI